MPYRISRFLLIPLLKIFFRLEIKGKNNIPKAGGFILASNHVSYLDPIVLGVCCPRQLNFMARHDLFTIPIFGPFLRAVGAFPLRRNFADIASIKEALRRLSENKAIVLFPEGSRSFKEHSTDVQPGIGFMVKKSQVPVVPAFINGTQRALGRHARFIRPTKIRVHFGKMIYPNSSEFNNSYINFASKVMREIKLLSQESKGV
jgi:1-acyl-sn-glycerol-3-phosphate acyltransferase